MHVSQDAARRPTAAEIIQCLRVGSPPYRFSGQSLARNEVALEDDSTLLFIEIWQRRKGGYTLAFSRWTGESWSPDASNAPTLAEAMDTLEHICATQNVSAVVPSADTAPPLISQIAKAVMVQNQMNMFQQLAGHALDRWTDLESSA